MCNTGARVSCHKIQSESQVLARSHSGLMCWFATPGRPRLESLFPCSPVSHSDSKEEVINAGEWGAGEQPWQSRMPQASTAAGINESQFGSKMPGFA